MRSRLSSQLWNRGGYSYLVERCKDGGYRVVDREGSVVYIEDDPNHAENAIQYAIDNLPDGGGKIVLGEGTFEVSDTINISKKGVVIEGSGSSTVISTQTFVYSIIYITGDFVEVHNIKLKKNQGGGGSNGFGIKVHSADNVTISGVVLEGTVLSDSPWNATPTWGMQGQYCHGLRYLHNYITNTGYEALTIWEDCTGCIYANNVVDHCGFGLVIEKEGTFGNTVVGNTIRDSQWAGTWDILIRSTHGNTIVGNVVLDREPAKIGPAIQVDGLSYDNIIANNVIRNAGGIHVKKYTFNNRIVDNSLRRIFYHSSRSKAGIYANNGKHNVIESNLISYCEKYGIWIANSPQVVIKNNQLLYGGVGSYGIYISGSPACDISGNRIIGFDNTAIVLWAESGYDVSDARVFNNVIEDPDNVSTILYEDAHAGDTEIQVQYIGNMQLGQYLSVGGETVRVIDIVSNEDAGTPVILTILPALSNDHNAGTSITGVPKQSKGIRCGGSGTLSPIYVYRNVIRDASSPIIGASYLTLQNNIGYATENSGTATIPSGSSSVTVNHGLAEAPSVVKLTGTHSEVKDCWVTDVTSTQFTIHASANVTADRDVYWEAKV